MFSIDKNEIRFEYYLTFPNKEIKTVACYVGNEVRNELQKVYEINHNLPQMIKVIKGIDFRYRKYQCTQIGDLNLICNEFQYNAHRIMYSLNFMLHKAWSILKNSELICVMHRLMNDYKQHINELASVPDVIIWMTGQIYKGLNEDWHESISMISDDWDMRIKMTTKQISRYNESMGNIYDFIVYMSDFHWASVSIAIVLCAACKIEELRKDLGFLKRVFDLYNIMECFLEEEKNLDKAQYDEIKELVAKSETSGLVADAAQAMKKITEVNISTLTQSEIGLLRGGCSELQKSLGIEKMENPRGSDRILQSLSEELSRLRTKVDELESQKGNEGKTNRECSKPSASATMDVVIEEGQNISQ